MRITEACVGCGSKSIYKSSAILMPFVSERIFGWKPFIVTGLRDVQSGATYALCNTLQCQSCGLVFCDMRFDDNEMKKLYSDYRGKVYTELRESYEPGYTKRNIQLIEENHVDVVEQFIGEDNFESILDFGGGDGSKTPFTNTSVIDVYDIANINVVRGRQIKQVINKYDLIICSHVLEHVSYPAEILFEIKWAMKHKSKLYIELPLENANEKIHWHEHINVFNQLSLHYLIDRVSMRITKYTETEVNNIKIIQALVECL